jgi:hypothetical protein
MLKKTKKPMKKEEYASPMAKKKHEKTESKAMKAKERKMGMPS